MQHAATPEATLESERHTEDILDGIGDAFFGLDRCWRVVYFNRAAEEFFDRPRDELLGRRIWDLYPETLGTPFERNYRRVMADRAPVEFQAPSAVRPGRWLSVRAFPTRNGLGVAFQDRTDSHRADEALRYQLSVTRAITDNTAEALFLMDEAGRVNFMNPAAEAMFGFSAAEMTGRVLHDMVHHHHPDGRPFPFKDCPLGQVLAGRALKVHEDVFFHKNGSPVAVSCSNTPVHKDGRIVGAALVVRDVTEQRRREAALRESEARFRHMADSAPALIWMTNETGEITFANMHYDHMFGRPAAQMHGSGWKSIVWPEDLEPFETAFTAAFEAGLPFQAEVRVKDRNDRVRWLRCEGVPRLDDAGRFLGYTGCNVDITEVKAAGDRQRLLINELNHRVKNTLTTVQSIAMQTLRNARSPGQARQDFEVRLFALSRAHDVLTRENWRGAYLQEIVEGAVEPYRPRGSTQFRIKGPEVRLSPRMTLALSMALHELVTNAVKYGALSTSTGKVDIAWAVVMGDAGQRLVLRWSEAGGPTVLPPARRGFGSRLIERSLAQDLDGTVGIEFAPTGVVCTVDAPLDAG